MLIVLDFMWIISKSGAKVEKIFVTAKFFLPSYEFLVMSYEFVVSIYFVQAMDNVSSLKWLREYSHRLARVLSHGIVSSLIFRWHGWHDGGSTK